MKDRDSGARGVRWERAGRPPPRPPDTATQRLSRLLHIIPAAAREGGASLVDLATALDVDVHTVLRDIQELPDLSQDRPAGAGDALQVTLDGDRVRIWSSGSFKRPARLTPREVLCVSLGLRLAALSPSLGPDGAAREALRERIEDRLTLRRRLEDGLARTPQTDLLDGFEAGDFHADPEGIREVLFGGVRRQAVCTIHYLKPDQSQPDERRIHPYVVVHSEGLWYVLAYCEKAEDVRSFRVDRILHAEVCADRFESPHDFDPSYFVQGGRVFDATGSTEAVVRYAPKIARWIAERGSGEWQEDGSYEVRVQVADPRWLVRHVLSYAGDAEVLEPERLRALVAEAAEALARAASE